MKDNKEVNINVRVTKDLKNKLKNFCEQNDIPISLVVRKAISFYLQKGEEVGLFLKGKGEKKL